MHFFVEKKLSTSYQQFIHNEKMHSQKMWITFAQKSLQIDNKKVKCG